MSKKKMKFMCVTFFSLCIFVMGHAQSTTSKWDYQHACYTNDSYGISWQLPTSVKWTSGNELTPGVPYVLNVHDKKGKVSAILTVQDVGGTGDTWEISPESYSHKLDELLPTDITLCSSEKTHIEGVKALLIKNEMKYIGTTVAYMYTIIFYYKGHSISAAVTHEISEDKKLIKSGKDIMSAYFDGITLY